MEFDHNQVFDEYLLKAGLKFTTQRKNVVDEVFKIHNHFEIENFISILRGKNIKVARATVYSTIKLLLDAKLIRKVRMGKGDIFYEHIFGHDHHDHLICLDCDFVTEVHDSDIENRQLKLCDKFGFILENHVHTMYVKCKKFAMTGKCDRKKE